MRRVQRDATKEDLIKAFTDPKSGVFTEMWRLLLFAALLGKSRGRREPLKQVNSNESIRAEVFSNFPIWPGLLHLLGVTESGASDTLKSENWERSLELFEEYANGGLTLLQEMMADGSDPVGFVSALMDSPSKSEDAEGTSSVSSIRL